MKRPLFVIVLAACALTACKPRSSEAPASPSAKNQDAIKALGSSVPEPNYDHTYWLKRHDANTPEWQEAKRLCAQTLLANYPNCLPVNDIVQADQRKKAEAGNRDAEKIEEMFRRGYQFDDVRKAWLPFREMQAAGCTYSYPRIGETTWQCPPSTAIPKGIPDPNFGEEAR